MSNAVIRQINLKKDNIILSVAAAHSVTEAQLQQDQAARLAVLTGASKIAQSDVVIGAVIALPISPTDHTGRVTASADTINGVDGEVSDFVLVRAVNPNLKPAAGGDDLVVEVIAYTGLVAMYGPVSSTLILPSPQTVIQVEDDIAEGLVTLFEGRQADVPVPALAPQGNNQQQPPLPGRASDRQDHEDVTRVKDLYITNALKSVFYTGIEDDAAMSPSTVNMKGALLYLERKIMEVFNTSLTDDVVIPEKDRKGLLLFLPFDLALFVPPAVRKKQAAYSVSDYVQMVTQVTRLMDGLYKPAVILQLRAMAQGFADYLSIPDPADGSVVGKAIIKQFAGVPSYLVAHPADPAPAAVTRLWTITADSPTVTGYNSQLLLKATRDMNTRLEVMARQSSIPTPNGGKGGRTPHVRSNPSAGGGPAAAGAGVNGRKNTKEFDDWLGSKPPGILDMSPGLCSYALAPKCPKPNCKFEHDFSKVPSEHQEATRKWLGEKPANKQPSNKRPRVR